VRTMRRPPLLSPGSRVALVAPAGPLSKTDLEHAITNARDLGWEPVAGDHVLEREGYLAGEDAHRAADLNRFAAADDIDAIWCIRGGYGAMRLLHDLDFRAWKQRPRALIGYSDITALHVAIGARAQLVTYHGPTARSALTDFSARSLRAAVIDQSEPCGEAESACTLHKGRARGRLVGGNLALVVSLLGTPFAPSFDDAILVLEDVNESVYRLDRMLTQLRLSGALERVAGIALGSFTDIPKDPTDAERPLMDVFAEIADAAGVPCLANVPVGHIADQWTVPLGAMAELDADAKTLITVS
jgi:muramoyltetrapeptide carboxypeptidase